MTMAYYRPVFLLSLFNRIVENQMYNRLIDFSQKIKYFLQGNLVFALVTISLMRIMTS